MEKRNALLNPINHYPYTDKNCLHAKDPYEVRDQFFINKHQGVDVNKFNNSRHFIEYSDGVDDIVENAEK